MELFDIAKMLSEVIPKLERRVEEEVRRTGGEGKGEED